jgi:hypothetical protein
MVMHDSDDHLTKAYGNAGTLTNAQLIADGTAAEELIAEELGAFAEALRARERESCRTALIKRGATICPWCDGRGERVANSFLRRVFCEPCDGTGEADRWHGPSAEDWRHRDAKATEAARWWRDHFPNETKKGATKSVAVESARDEARAGGGQ